MKNLVPINLDDNFGVTAVGNTPMVSSRKVAKVFIKRHDNVLRDIESVRNDLLGIEGTNSDEVTHLKNEVSAEFWQRNFRQSTYKDSTGRKLPEYLLTRDGFTLLTMGFTGKRAMRFKVAYINRFNEMEQFIKNRTAARLEHPELTDGIKQAHNPAKFYHYRNEADMINRIVLGMTAKQFRLAHGLTKNESIRDRLTSQQIEAIQRLQKLDSVLVVAMPDYQQRKQSLETYYRQLLQPKELPTGTTG